MQLKAKNETHLYEDFHICTEGKLWRHQVVKLRVQKADGKWHQDQQATEAGVHDDQVVQRVTDGHQPVIGHHRQKETLQACKKRKDGHLS